MSGSKESFRMSNNKVHPEPNSIAYSCAPSPQVEAEPVSCGT